MKRLKYINNCNHLRNLMNYHERFDVIVIGGGHAGTEAAASSARMGMNTLLLTHNIETLGQMSCNPSIGGIGKGHLVKEIDALGGLMGTAIDKAGIHFRILNATKGPAVRATRAQADRILYKAAIREALEKQENLKIFQQEVEDLVIENHRVSGAITKMGVTFYAKTVILTVGTFLNGLIHIGLKNFSGGRAGSPASIKLADRLKALPLRMGRLKTGTPARIDARSINFSVLEVQEGDRPTPAFSFLVNRYDHPRQIPCYITHTNNKTHDIIRKHLNKSPLYTGTISGVGPRYCPSVEDKIMRFADKNSHQIFVEPEGLTTNEVYPNGISTSLPFNAQVEFIQSIKGFENAFITRPGYAIEYDYFDPRDLKSTLEIKFIKGLFFAGQINGTTGYEEAGAQGLLAGINAALQSQGKEGWCPRRDQAYLGVLVDDLSTLGTKEPYRMFTSRAEYRLLLREDNADARLTEKGRELGLVNDTRWKLFLEKQQAIDKESQRLKEHWVNPNSSNIDAINELIKKPMQRESTLEEIIRRPEVSYYNLMKIKGLGPAIENKKAAEQVEIKIKYKGYIDRQLVEIEKLKRNESTLLPINLDYSIIDGLSAEVVAKLTDIKPENIGQASRISGITPAAVSILLIYLKKNGLKRKVSL